MGEIITLFSREIASTVAAELHPYVQAVQSVVVSELLQRDRDSSVHDEQAAIDARTYTALASRLAGIEQNR